MISLRSLQLEARHVALGARFGEFAGWRMPLWYEGALKEHMAVRTAAGVFDVSHMGRFRIRGPDAAGVLATALSLDLRRLAPGRAAYALACNESGGIIDDLMVYRLGEDAFVVICNASNVEAIRELLRATLTGSASSLEDVQAQTVLLAVQGPEAAGRVANILSPNVASIPRRACRELVWGGETCFLGRTGYTGEDGFEVMTSLSAGSELLDRLLAEGVMPCGLVARDSLRLEAALPLHGADIDESTTPWEAGLGWAVDLDHEFGGRDALLARKDATTRHLVCMISDGQGVFRSHQDVYQGEQPVSSVSSGGFSPMLDRSIAMAYLPSHLATPGTSLEIDIRGRRVACHIVNRPFYKRSGTSQPKRSSS